ncbi:MAG: hypothetical protein JW809_10340 [Pirellulales bacterium]|nr:hypothetical protein [Pirellulales bacterium]
MSTPTNVRYLAPNVAVQTSSTNQETELIREEYPSSDVRPHAEKMIVTAGQEDYLNQLIRARARLRGQQEIAALENELAEAGVSVEPIRAEANMTSAMGAAGRNHHRAPAATGGKETDMSTTISPERAAQVERANQEYLAANETVIQREDRLYPHGRRNFQADAPRPVGPSEAEKVRDHFAGRLAERAIGPISAMKELAEAKTGRYVSVPRHTVAAACLGDPEAVREVYGADVPYGTPGDFPNILSAAANKIVEGAMQYTGTTFRRWAHQLKSVPNFKPATILRLGEFGELPQHVDGHDFEQSTFPESYQSIQVESYGDEFALTPRMILDDNLGAFAEALADKVAAHDHTLNSLCLRLLTGNEECIDGYPLIDAEHTNLQTPGAPPSVAQLDAMRLLLRQQMGLAGKRRAGLPLSLLLVPSALETTTQKLLRVDLNVTPTSAGAANPFRGEVDYVVETGLDAVSATAYYGFAPPRAGRSIVYVYQEGFEVMRQRSYFSPQNNCRVFQVEGRFAVAMNDFRGVVRNDGTGSEE